MSDGPYERARLDLAEHAAAAQRSPCFICTVIAGTHQHHHPVVYRDDTAIAFMNRFPTLLGYVLVAPTDHLEDVVGDFAEEDYLQLQSVIYRVGRAISRVLPTERLYVLSLGSKQGNSHVHWHLAPLPPGVPYGEQQYHALMMESRGYLEMPAADQEALAARIAAAMEWR